MSNHVYRVTEIVGSSPDSLQQAIRNGVERAGRTLRNVEWFEVTEIRGQVEDGAVAHFQVGLKVGFRLEDDDRPDAS
jgi:flavin-binding protein dodecin